jgi:hypothetical protein
MVGTKLTLYTNGVSIHLWYFDDGTSLRYGAWGGAAVGFILNSGYVLIELPADASSPSRGEQWEMDFGM